MTEVKGFVLIVFGFAVFGLLALLYYTALVVAFVLDKGIALFHKVRARFS